MCSKLFYIFIIVDLDRITVDRINEIIFASNVTILTVSPPIEAIGTNSRLQRPFLRLTSPFKGQGSADALRRNLNDLNKKIGSDLQPVFTSRKIMDQKSPGGYSQKIWVGVCGPLPKTLTLFMTKICDFPYPIYDLTKNLILNLYLFQTCLIIISLVQTNVKGNVYLQRADRRRGMLKK